MVYHIKKLDYDDILLYREDLVDIFIQMEEKKSNKIRKTWEEKVDEMNLYVRKKEAIVFGALDNNNLISFIWAYFRFFANEKRIHVNYFGTKEEYRGKSIGGKLLKHIEIFAKENGVNKLDLNVDVNNCRAINFYTKNGFNNEKILMSKKI